MYVLVQAVQRALASSLADHHQFMLQLELRVVREFNLPDTFVSVLQNALEENIVNSTIVFFPLEI